MLLDNVREPQPHPLRSLMRMNGIPGWRVAQAVNVSEPKLYKILKGLQKPSPELAEKLEAIRTELLNLSNQAPTSYRRTATS